MKQFYVWITTPNPEFLDDLIGRLVKQGFTVGPLGRSAVLDYVDKPAKVVALSIIRTPNTEDEKKLYSATGIHDEIVDLLRLCHAKTFSIVVSEAAGCTWNTGNMSVAKMEEDELRKKGLIN